MSQPWVHNMSPFLIEFSEGFGIRWYGLAYLTGFFLAYFFVDYLAKKGRTLLTREQAGDLVTYAAIGTLIGGRLGYALFYSPDLFVTFHSSFPFWAVLEVHKGGMASHGGMIGIAAACLLFARKHKLMTTHLIDLLCLGGPLGVFFGRIANFINGELYGRECASDSFLAIKFPTEIYSWSLSEVEKLKALGPAVQALGEITTRSGEKISATVDLWGTWLSNSTFQSQRYIDLFREALVQATERHNVDVIAALGPALTPRYPSQLIQALLEGLIVFIILFWAWRKPRKPGVISALYGVCYAVARIIGEQFRLPDHDIGYQALGLTRGQWLSIAMLAIFVVYLVFVLRRQAERIGGWGKSNN